MKLKSKKIYQIIIALETPSTSEGLKLAGNKAYEAGFEVLEIKHLPKYRTIPQNNALHLWFGQLSEALNDKHIDMRALIRKEVEIPWSGFSVKEYLWRPLQRAYFGDISTTKLTTDKINKIYDVIIKTIVERTKGSGLEIPPFPSKETREELAIKKLDYGN